MEKFISIMFMIITLEKGVSLITLGRDIILDQNEYLFTTSSEQGFIFESDESNITKITNIGLKFIDYAFSIEFPSSNKLLHIAITNSFKYWQQNAYCVCQLLQYQQNYNIVCIDGIQTNQKNYSSKNQKEQQKYQINIIKDQEEQCKELVFDSENQIITVCASKKVLKVIKVNLNEQFSTQTELQLEFNISNCSSKLFHYNQYVFFIFYNCENWKIINISNNAGITIILDKKLLQKVDQKNEIQIEYLSEIFRCQNYIYLVDFRNYYGFEYVGRSFINFSRNFLDYIIKMITFNTHCSNKHIILFNESQSDQIIKFNFHEQTIIVNTDQQDEFYATSEFLFLRQKNKINLILCNFLNQTYEILSSKIYFLDQYQNNNSHQAYHLNIFYQIDETTSKVIFYEYYNRLQIFKPKKAYLHQIVGFNMYTNFDNYIITQKIVFSQDLIQKIQSYDVLLENDCQQKLYSQFVKRQHGLPYDYQLLYQKQQVNFTLSIDDEDYFNLSGQDSAEIDKIFWINQFEVNKLDKLDLYLTKQDQIVYNFKLPLQKQIYSLNRQNTSVFRFLDTIAIVNFQVNQLAIPFISKQNTISFQNYNFNQTIINITQCQQCLIFSFSDTTYKVFDIQRQEQVQISEQWIKFGIPRCFFYKANLFLLQFEQFLIHQNKDNLIMIHLENVQIYRITFQTVGLLIKAIHNQEDKIITYFSTGNSLTKLYETEITTNSKFVRPLILSHSENYVSIASITNSQKSILIFSVEKAISILKIKYCSNFNFILEQGTLIYFNQEERLKVFYLEYFNISIQNLSNQQNHKDIYQQNIVIFYQENNQMVSKQKTLNIIIQNFCYKLLKQQDLLCLFNSRSFLNLYQLFQGPITNLTTSSKNIAVSDLLNIHNIQDCGNQSTIQNDCIIQYTTIFKSSITYFKFKCIKNSAYCELFPMHIMNGITIIKHKTLQNYSLQLNVIKLVDKNFIHLFSVDHKNFRLIEISFLEIEFNGGVRDVNIKNFLIKVQNEKKAAFLYMQKNSFSKHIIFNSVIDYDLILNSEDLYLILELLNGNDLEWKLNCQIIFFKNNEKMIKQSFILENDFVEFINSVFSKMLLFDSRIELISSQIFQSKVELILFIIDRNFSCEVYIIQNFETGKQQFKIIRIIRNPFNEFNLFLAFRDKNYIIISSANRIYIYNITQNLSMYDYIGSLFYDNIQLFQLNTTHYILCDFQNISLVEIKYQVTVEATENSINEKSFLLAQNQVSSEELEIIVRENQNQIIQGEKRSFFQFYILGIIIILIMIYIIRRKIIKQRKHIENRFQELKRNETI